MPRPSHPARTPRHFASPHHPRARAHHDGGRDPAVPGPAPSAVPRPDYGARLFRPRRRTRMASTPLGTTSRRCARLGPASHVQTRRPCRRPPITARYDYDTVSLSAPILSPLRPFLRWPGPALGLSPLHYRDPAVTGPGLARARGKSMHPDRALRAPTQDSDRHPRYSAPRHAVVHGSARPYAHRLGDRDCGSSTTAKYTATWSPIRLTAAVTLRSTARPVPRHSVRTRLFTSRHRTRMEPEPLGATSHRGARLGPALHAQTRRPCRWLLDYCQIHRDMASHRAHGGRDPAVHGPARPSALRPDQTLPAPTQD